MPGIGVHHALPSPLTDLQAHAAGDVRVCRISGDRLRYGPAPGGDPSATMLASFVISGSCTVRQDGQDVRIDAGHYVFHDLTRPFQVDFQDPFEALLVGFSENAIIRAVGCPEIIATQPFGSNSGLSALAASYLHRLADYLRDLDERTFARLSGTAVSLLAISAAEIIKPRRQNSWTRSATLKRIKSYSLARLQTPGLSPARAAADIGISIRYLHALFRQEGETFSSWLWSQRLEACRAKISSPDFKQQTIGALALEFGFSNFSHFSRRFRRAYGVSARELRMQLFGRQS
ncbi:helix-turn-helix domain-containing protein [Bradyrhizobium sp. U87765 SZCCT0131]|uniref:helix-turn-helix domain-containing protein n=1 Tax=unclassified Bradyrhizobium TaxID=2631580 RepID=UPI001BA9392E|nr:MULTISPECIES: helix-turn-helix domain-containing protein [unclassified Bradyrhizobium]MBR1217731.1 helix-turn-helix domain-containing protein [Bradyrhizobium sp. U87765 SZCCT0131]MBR1261323.1 helix-turn-helix domain-containing protein [Bradyrhizobium sp. U87765 SZCCT0134]MBR1303229.1 helix-turn-helix domain-containing protein [Bradyrhizobium sp. U87765 SZCCT0110]MBR1318835.1 helix-turn-helix domain-containing protein [Bradyrhizobium sp. U87765 SZCCT0109]MBR1347160.1 helix-turn-helix domain-